MGYGEKVTSQSSYFTSCGFLMIFRSCLWENKRPSCSSSIRISFIISEETAPEACSRCLSTISSNF